MTLYDKAREAIGEHVLNDDTLDSIAVLCDIIEELMGYKEMHCKEITFDYNDVNKSFLAMFVSDMICLTSDMFEDLKVALEECCTFEIMGRDDDMISLVFIIEEASCE